MQYSIYFLRLIIFIRQFPFLAEADAEALRTTGRSDEENTPSALVQTISKLMSEFMDIFKGGLSSFFRTAKEGEDEEEEQEPQQKEDKQQNRRDGSSVQGEESLRKNRCFGLVPLNGVVSRGNNPEIGFVLTCE